MNADFLRLYQTWQAGSAYAHSHSIGQARGRFGIRVDGELQKVCSNGILMLGLVGKWHSDVTTSDMFAVLIRYRPALSEKIDVEAVHYQPRLFDLLVKLNDGGFYASTPYVEVKEHGFQQIENLLHLLASDDYDLGRVRLKFVEGYLHYSIRERDWLAI